MVSDSHRLGASVRLRVCRLVSAATLVSLLLMAAGAHAQADQVIAGSAIYVRQDTDDTTVIAPRLHVGAPIAEGTRADLVYTVDVWTSASIDIVASASKPVTEQRDEIDVTLSQEWSDISLAGTYRFSHEPDYVSHGGTIGASLAFANKSSTLDLRLGGFFDEVGRAGYPTFEKPVRNLSAKLGFTQLLDPETYVQVAYELMNAHGYNSSPYRFIGIGSRDGTCRFQPQFETPPLYCIPEQNPNDRLRHAAALTFRRALGGSLAAGLEYRFYFDDWGVMSHTAQAELDWTIDRTILSLRYRFYTQSDADHYKPAYDVTDTSEQFFTTDKELSAFMAHKLGLDLEHEFELDERGHTLSLVLSAAPALFLYSNFRPLDNIKAIEVTLATVLKL